MRHSVMIKEKLTFFVLVSSPATNPASLGLKSGSRPQSANFNKRERVRFLFQCKYSGRRAAWKIWQKEKSRA